MSRTNSAKVEFYKVTIQTVMSLIEERTGNAMEAIDPSMERKVDNAVAYGNVSELKKIHKALDDMYDAVKKKSLGNMRLDSTIKLTVV